MTFGLFLSGNVFANHFSYKVPEVKVKEFDRWMGKLKRKDGKWYFKSPKKFKKIDIGQASIFLRVENPRCRLLANFGVGYNHIDVNKAKKKWQRQ